MVAQLKSISDEQFENLKEKHQSFGSPEGGIVSVAESVINFKEDRDLLFSLIEENKLQQFPITIQKNVSASLTQIQTAISNIIAGNNHFSSLVTQIEGLHALIWTYNLRVISNEKIVFETKMNALKTFEKLMADSLNTSVSLKEKIGGVVDTVNQLAKNTLESNKAAEDSSQKTLKLLALMQEQEKTTSEALSTVTNLVTQTTAVFSGVQQTESLVKKLHSEANVEATDINSLKDKIVAFHLEIEEHKKTMEGIITSSEGIIKVHKEEVDKLVLVLNKQSADIKDKLLKATGFSLFTSFDKRKTTVFIGRIIWGGVVAGIVIAMVIYNLVLFDNLGRKKIELDSLFWLRVAFNLPFIFIIGFATVQYSRERKLEEEYAFKSNISVSLTAYRELVEGILLKDDGTGHTFQRTAVIRAREEFTKFLIGAVDNIYSSPTERVFGDHKKEVSLEALAKNIKPLLDMFQTVKGKKDHDE